MTTLQSINASASPEVQMNENLAAVAPAGAFAKKASTTSGLTFGYYGGVLLVDGVLTSIADGTVTLTDSATNYIERTLAGVVSKNTSGFTSGQVPLYTAVTSGGVITLLTNCRIAYAPMRGSFGARGIDCVNNSGTPNTQYDLDADEIVLRDASGQTAIRIAPGAAITNNVSTSGPAANGRDQSGAFSASSWVHFYWIWNGATLATLSSATAPPTGPALPSGYTHWAYAGAVRFNGSSQLVPTYIKGKTAFYQNRAAAVLLSGGTATVETSVSLAAAVPPNALSVLLNGIVNQTNATTGGSDTSDIRIASGVNYLRIGCSTSTQAAPDNGRADVFFVAPNVGQNLYYLNTRNSAGGSFTLDLLTEGYTLPNGGE